MSRKEPSIKYETTVKKSGNGAVINSYKKFVGKKAIVIIKEEIK